MAPACHTGVSERFIMTLRGLQHLVLGKLKKNLSEDCRIVADTWSRRLVKISKML